MQSQATDAEPQVTPESLRSESLREAFRHLHGSRLHGFALLVSLGDARRAERAASEALASGEARATSLRHPERAAAWVRAQVVPKLRRARRPDRTDAAARRVALRGLGVDEAAFDGLAALDFDARVAFVASSIERFAPLDIETILGAGPAATHRAIERARRRYLSVVAGPPEGDGPSPSAGADLEGELARRVRTVAERALSGARSTGFA